MERVWSVALALAAAVGLAACSFPVAAPTPIHPAAGSPATGVTSTPFLPETPTPGGPGESLPVPSMTRTAVVSATPLGTTLPGEAPPAPPVAAQPTATPASPPGAQAGDGLRALLQPVADEILTLINLDRSQLGLPDLQSSPALIEFAFSRCDAMVAGGYFDHNAPGGAEVPVRSLLLGAGFGGRLAETLYATTSPTSEVASETVAAWMADAQNRAVLLDGAYSFAGVGIAGDGTWWTIAQVLAETGP